jgi:predicted ATPase
VEVALSDVGFGISQILPFVVQSLAASDQIISIEQPEVHIHPRLQADLGDLLIEAIKEPRQNQFLIETHSEHLALRLQRRVREKKLSPDQISIVYVSRGPNGATVQPLRLDEEGDFIDDFPGGFFPERLRELR